MVCLWGETCPTSGGYYDAKIGRFAGVDPIAEKFAWVAGYNYAEDEPVGGIDLWGLQRLASTTISPNGSVTQNLVPISVTASRETGEVTSVAWDHEEYPYWGPIAGGIGSSNVNLWAGMGNMSPGYNGYVYDEYDLRLRYKYYLLKDRGLAAVESSGVFQPLTYQNYWATYGETLGNLMLAETFITEGAGLAAATQGGNVQIRARGYSLRGLQPHGGNAGIDTPYSQATFNSFQKQLQQHGINSILRSRATIQKRLDEHFLKLEAIKKAGGHASSVEREINTFKSQLRAIDDLINQ